MSVSENLPSNDLAKILFFIVIQTATCFLFFWGVLPTILLFVAYLLSRRDKDLSMLNKAITFARRYAFLSIVIGVGIIVFIGLFDTDSDYMSDFLKNAFLGVVLILGIGLCYIFFLNYLFRNPLNRYQAFVAENGIFGSSVRSQKELSILKTENMKSYSVADELLKWKELKDQGLVTEKEFEEMKRKIMGG
ncbi:SHOCT domain-containing protein [Acinetobacter brisouii]